MKKLLSILIIACLTMTLLYIVPVSAANDEVLRGTPEIDGVVDGIYKGSLTIVYDGSAVENYTATGNFYALYDDDYLYLCADVKDDDVVSAADSFIYENVNPYGGDVVEFRLDLGGGEPGSMDNFFKVGIDAFGKRIYSPMGISCDLAACKYATKVNNDGYVIEVAIPYGQRENDDMVGAGKLGLKVWLFDMFGEYAGIDAPADNVHFLGYAPSINGEGGGDRVFYNLSNKKATAPAGEDTTAPEEDTTAPKGDDKEPTSDKVLRGTPTIDGNVDGIYTGSLTVVYDGSAVEDYTATGKFYALYDDDYLYLCANVKDDDVVSAADSFIYENVNPYGGDVVEFRLDLGGGEPASMDNFFKVGIDAFGKRIYSPMGISCDLEACKYATKVTADGYVIEVAIPYGGRDNDDMVGAGKLGLKVWLFDMFGEYAGIDAPADNVHFRGYAPSINGEGGGDRVFYELSNKTAVAVEPDDTTPAVDTTTPVEDDTTAPVEDDTTAPVEDDDTTAPEEDDDTTAPKDDTTAPKDDDSKTDTEKDGLSGGAIAAIVAAVVVVVGAVVGVVIKKRK